MTEPSEKWLDRHFKQQLAEYDNVFKYTACKSDQHIITYWLQIFRAAPKPQKWARNGLVLLMYGHLKEIGYLQVPFTDMRNVGKNLNEILDSYKGLPMINRNKATQIATPVWQQALNEDRSQHYRGSVSSNAKSRPPPQCPNHSDKENWCAPKAGELTLNKKPDILQLLYDTFDSHRCYKHSNLTSDTETNNFFESVMGLDALTQTPLATIKEESSRLPETALNAAQDKRQESKPNEKDSFSEKDETSSLNSHLNKQTEKKKYKTKRELNQQRFSNNSIRIEDGTSEATSPTGATEAEIFELRQRNKELRRQCLLYYTKRGKFRKRPKLNDGQDLGFPVGAHRSQRVLRKYSSWHNYRRILLNSCVSRPIKAKTDSASLGQQQLELVLGTLKTKYLALAKDLKCKRHTNVK